VFLLEPPQVRELEVFTRMPAKFRRSGQRCSWADANRGGQSVDSFLEGPVVDEAGNLYVTDVPWGRVFRIDERGDWDLVVEYDGEPNGMKFTDAHTLLIADHAKGLLRLDVRSGGLTSHLSRRNTEGFKGLNDLIFDSRGNLFFTDQGQTGLQDPSGRVYRLAPDGKLDMLLSNVPSPNGIALSPDEQVLYVAVTRGNCVWRGPLRSDGSMTKVGQFFTSYGPVGPDGLAVDVQGRLFVANPGLGYVWMLDALGRPINVFRGPAGSSTTNLAFGGLDRKTLFVTDSTNGAILRAELAVPGASLHVPG
jgi:gluconolactonase